MRSVRKEIRNYDTSRKEIDDRIDNAIWSWVYDEIWNPIGFTVDDHLWIVMWNRIRQSIKNEKNVHR